eukprot:1632650-Prorocentrum_lima.AAC.1
MAKTRPMCACLLVLRASEEASAHSLTTDSSHVLMDRNQSHSLSNAALAFGLVKASLREQE